MDPFDVDPEELEPEPVPLWVRLAQGAVALILVLAFFNMSGLYQFTLFQRTPSEIEQPPLAASLDTTELAIPVRAVLLRAEDARASERAVEEVPDLVTKASNIWQQANISLCLVGISERSISEADLSSFPDNPDAFIEAQSLHDSSVITIVLAGTLGGINGVSFGGANVVAVADYTTVHDFRTLAHEIGHQLSLPHVSGLQNRLLYRGANGVSLSLEEIVSARSVAESLHSNNCP